MTPEALLAFEREIEDEFAAGNIAAPVHLSGGNETDLIDLFAGIQPDDWVLCGWRSHYHCLLKGVPRDKLKAAIMEGRSVGLCFPEHKILCSGIVGGIAPIAVGIAWQLKRVNDDNHMGHETHVHCFLGDMSAETGIAHEAIKYATRHDLPVKWIVEDNGQSVCTDTKRSWGLGYYFEPDVTRYEYTLSRPHVGIGKWVAF